MVQDEIKYVVKTVCKFVPGRSARNRCDKFIDKYADIVIDLLLTTEPSLVCSVMKLCGGDIRAVDTDLVKSKLCLHKVVSCKCLLVEKVNMICVETICPLCLFLRFYLDDFISFFVIYEIIKNNCDDFVNDKCAVIFD